MKRVEVKFNSERGGVEVLLPDGGEPPNFGEVSKFLPLKVAKRLSRSRSRSLTWESISSLAEENQSWIPFQVWADALAEWLIVKEANATGARSEVRAVVQGAYLAMGTTLFKLSPVDMIPQNKALAAAKARALSRAKVAGSALMAEARTNVRGMLQAGLERKKKLEREVEGLERKLVGVLPRWVQDAGIPTRFRMGSWELQISFTHKLGSIWAGWEVGAGRSRLERHELEFPVTGVRSIQKLAWMPISPEGSYSLSNLVLDKICQEMAHMSHSGSCMSLGDAPEKLASVEDCTKLGASLERAMSQMNLQSLLGGMSEVVSQYEDGLPPDLYIALRSGDSRAVNGWMAAYANEKGITTLVAEDSERGETWDTTHS